jgi:hypothetical protein
MYFKLNKYKWVKIDKTGIIICLRQDFQIYMVYKSMFKNNKLFITSRTHVKRR